MSDHGARALVLAAVSLIAVGTMLWWVAGRSTEIADIAEAVAAAEPGDVLHLDDLIDPSWGELHVFAPSTPPHLVEAAVGRRVGEVRGLVRDEIMLLVLTDGVDRVVASGLVARQPVDWLPAARNRPYPRAEAVFRIVVEDGGRELHPDAAVER